MYHTRIEINTDIRKEVIMTESFIPNKIKKIISTSENIYTSEDCCVLKILDKNNSKKVLKISPYNEDEYNLLMILKQSDNKHLLKPEIIQRKNGFIYVIYPHKKTLLENISSDGFNFCNLLRLSIDLCQGITFLHEKKYLHLDISPDNIYLNDDSSFCIGDYSSVRRSGKISNQRNLYLTPGYSPPEFTALQKSKLSINELSDEYSLAKTILSLFQEKYNNKEEDNDNIKEDTNLLENFNQILMKACSEIQEFRYPSISEFKNAIFSFEKQNENSITDFQLNINISNNLFNNLKTLPIKKEQAVICTNTFFSFINTPVFMTIAIVLAILLPAMVLYNIFFLPHMSGMPSNEAVKTIASTSTIPNNPIKKTVFESNSPDNTSTMTVPASAIPKTDLPQAKNNIANTTSPPPISYISEFDVGQHIIKKLSADKLKKIAGKPLDNSSLKILSANNNLIYDISDISSFPNIEELYISNNKIKNIDTLAKLKHLKTLVISSNSIEDIYMLSKIKTLENLDLSCNKKLKNITSLTKLKSLRLLCISETNISQKEVLRLKRSLPDCEIID